MGKRSGSVFDKGKFLTLLFASHNIGGNAEPEGSGIALSEAALEAATALADIAARSPVHAAGVCIASRLMVEVLAAPSPNQYMVIEAERGFSGKRHGDDGATIVVCTETDYVHHEQSVEE